MKIKIETAVITHYSLGRVEVTQVAEVIYDNVGAISGEDDIIFIYDTNGKSLDMVFTRHNPIFSLVEETDAKIHTP